MLKSNFQGFIGAESAYKDADMVIYGAPFDSTTSFRPGARFGPNAIRQESFGIETYSPYQDKDLLDYNIFDYGDIELPFGNTRLALDMIKDVARQILRDDKLPILLGGEHLVTLGQVEALKEKYDDFYIIHFDAHCDLRQEYLGCELSHASVIRRCYDLLGNDRIFQFGIRSGDRSEFEFSKQGNTYINKFNFDTLQEVVKSLEGKNVYFTIDLDVLDTSVFSGTGTPEAGGVTFNELLKAILEVSKLNIIGLDMVELAPMLDASGSSTALACKTLRELLLAINRR